MLIKRERRVSMWHAPLSFPLSPFRDISYSTYTLGMRGAIMETTS